MLHWTKRRIKKPKKQHAYNQCHYVFYKWFLKIPTLTCSIYKIITHLSTYVWATCFFVAIKLVFYLEYVLVVLDYLNDAVLVWWTECTKRTQSKLLIWWTRKQKIFGEFIRVLWHLLMRTLCMMLLLIHVHRRIWTRNGTTNYPLILF